MASTQTFQLASYCQETARQAKLASRKTAVLSTDVKNRWIKRSAAALRANVDRILQANQQDLDRAEEFQLTAAQIDRLRLTAERIEAIASGLEQIAGLPDPIGEVLSTYHAPNGLEIKRVRVPLGVVFFIYESRPNVTVDAAAICLKSGNAVILRGGKEAAHSSNTLIEILAEVGDEVGIPANAIQLVQTPDREAVRHFLSLSKYIDLAIPRGGESLIRHVVEHATMPVLKHFEGNCHVYVDEHADLGKAERIVINAKCQRPGVCNACESLLVHEKIAPQFIPRICQLLDEQNVEMVGDPNIRKLDSRVGLATEQDYATEFLDLKISICQVAGIEQAIEHINHYGSGHTDAIVTEDRQAAEKFCAEVDSSAVMVNASTRFNDGGEFGLGAEIGISTDKFHARGPCGINELTTYKYLCLGTGQTR